MKLANSLLAGILVAVVSAFGLIGCGGGDGGDSSYDPTGTTWQFLVTAADAGTTMYTLTFFDSSGAKAASGLFTAANDKGASYSGSWQSSGYVVAGAASTSFLFKLTVNADTASGTIEYVTPEGSGSAAATRTDAGASSGSGTSSDATGTMRVVINNLGSTNPDYVCGSSYTYTVEVRDSKGTRTAQSAIRADVEFTISVRSSSFSLHWKVNERNFDLGWRDYTTSSSQPIELPCLGGPVSGGGGT